MNRHTVSFWNQTGHKTHYPRLTHSISTDVVIIGGGITGVTCAYCLAQKGLKPVLIEAGALCDGTTGNTTGKVTIQHGIVYDKLMKKYGLAAARDYALSQKNAMEFVKNTVEKESIKCQLALNTAYAYAENINEWDTLEKEYETARKIGIEAELIRHAAFPPGNHGMLGFRDQYVLHAIRYVNGLAEAAVKKGAEIYCSTKAVKLEPEDIKIVHCENDIDITAKHVVMATQYPFYDGPNLFYARLYPKRTYGIAVTARKDWPDGSYINIGNPTRSIRTHIEDGKRILIVVGDSHDTGRGYEDMMLHYENLMNFADKLADVSEVIAMWSAQDYDTPDELPYIGRISNHSTIYVATGFRKWGLTNGTLSGSMLAELITEGKCSYEGLYARSRSDFFDLSRKSVCRRRQPGRRAHQIEAGRNGGY